MGLDPLSGLEPEPCMLGRLSHDKLSQAASFHASSSGYCRAGEDSIRVAWVVPQGAKPQSLSLIHI